MLRTTRFLPRSFLRYSLFNVQQARSNSSHENLSTDQSEWVSKISQLCETNLHDKAALVFKEMKSKGIKPNLQIYNILLNGFANRKRLEIVKEYFREIELDSTLQPDHESITAMIRVVGLEEGLEEAHQVLLQMGKYNLTPSISNYNELFYICGEKRKMLEATKIFEEMLNNQIMPNVNTYNRLIGVMMHSKNIENSKDIITRMKIENIEPNAETYRYLIKACGEAKQFSELLNTLKELQANKNINSKTSIIYDSVIEACIKCDKLEEALKCYEEMKVEEVQPLPSTFDTLIVHCENNDGFNTAKSLIFDFKDLGLTPTRHISRVERKVKFVYGDYVFKKENRHQK